MLVRWSPFGEIGSVEDEFERLVSRAFGTRERSWMPALDAYETEDKLVVKVELAGLDPDDVEVSVEAGMLKVSGKREFASEVNEEHYHRIERSYGSFSRSVRLPKTADADGVDASFDKGVLTVEVPKREVAKPKRIEIKAKS